MTSMLSSEAVRDAERYLTMECAELEAMAVNPDGSTRCPVARSILADLYEEQSRIEGAAILRSETFMPEPLESTRERVDSMTDDERAQMAEWARRWIDIGLRAGPTTGADHHLFRLAIEGCYEAAGLAPPRRIVWTTSPVAAVLAGPIAARVLGDGAVRGAVRFAVYGAVDGAVRGAVDVAVRGAVDGAVRGAVDVAVGGAVDGAVDGAVGDAVRGAVSGAVRDSVDNANLSWLTSAWWRYLGGQPWVGWGCGGRGPGYVSFMQDVLRLRLAPKLERAARAYQALCRTCWWVWPHQEFAVVAPRPSRIELDTNGKLLVAEWPDGSRVERGKLNVDVRRVLESLGSMTRGGV